LSPFEATHDGFCCASFCLARPGALRNSCNTAWSCWPRRRHLLDPHRRRASGPPARVSSWGVPGVGSGRSCGVSGLGGAIHSTRSRLACRCSIRATNPPSLHITRRRRSEWRVSAGLYWLGQSTPAGVHTGVDHLMDRLHELTFLALPHPVRVDAALGVPIESILDRQRRVAGPTTAPVPGSVGDQRLAAA
jgi:hypothetical protein